MTTKDNTKEVQNKQPTTKSDPYLQRSRERVTRDRRDDIVALGPNYINKDELGIKDDVARWVHVEDPGKFDQMLNLGYRVVCDENGDPIHKKVRQGQEVKESYLMSTPKEMYDEGQRRKSEERKKTKERAQRHEDASMPDGVFRVN